MARVNPNRLLWILIDISVNLLPISIIVPVPGPRIPVTQPPALPPTNPAAHENWVNSPNIITISRLALSVVLFVLISVWKGAGCGIAAAVLFTIAVLTDALDGYLARKYNLITQLGRILDPFADKVIVLGTFIFLLERRPESGVNAAMVVIVLARELLVTGLRSFLEQHGQDFSANLIGKIKMMLQSVALVGSLLSISPMFQANAGFLLVRDILLWSAVAVTVYSGWIYILRAMQLLRTK